MIFHIVNGTVLIKYQYEKSFIGQVGNRIVHKLIIINTNCNMNNEEKYLED